jgi:hypothetical protein
MVMTVFVWRATPAQVGLRLQQTAMSYADCRSCSAGSDLLGGIRPLVVSIEALVQCWGGILRTDADTNTNALEVLLSQSAMVRDSW